MAKANQVLANPADEALLKLYDDELLETNDLCINVATPFRQELQQDNHSLLQASLMDDDEVLQAADGLITILPRLVDAAQRVQANPNDKSAQEALAVLLDDVQSESRTISSSLVNSDVAPLKATINNITAKLNPHTYGAVDTATLLTSAQELAGAIAQLAANAKSDVYKRAGSAEAAAKELDAVLANLGNHVKANKSKPASKSQVAELLADLDKLTVASKKEPSTKEKEESLKKDSPQAVEAVADKLAKQAKTKGQQLSAPVLSACENVAEGLNKLAAAAKKHR